MSKLENDSGQMTNSSLKETFDKNFLSFDEQDFRKSIDQPDSSVPIIRLIVDSDLQNKTSSSKSPNTFEFRHKDSSADLNEENCRSIFELKSHHHQYHLKSLGNERPDNRLTNQIENEINYTNKSSDQVVFLPTLVSQTLNKENKISEKNLLQLPTYKENKYGNKAKKLYDYNDVAYLERSRRARRRKQSEVDIEVGLRLSRYISQPYEGCADKYSKKYKKNFLRKTRGGFNQFNQTSSSEESSLNSSSEHINTLQLSARVANLNDEEIRSYLWNRRGLRRRSLSSSPPRIKARESSLSSFQGSISTNISPIVSPSPSTGPASPALSRYHKTNFTTILNSADIRKRFDSHKELTFPSIQNPLSKPNQQKYRVGEKFLSQSLPNGTNISIFELNSQSTSEKQSNMEKQNPCIKSIAMGKAKTAVKPSSPVSLRKHVLLNTALPCGSSTFQQAMESLQPTKDETTLENCSKAQVVVGTGSSKGRIKTLSGGGKRKVFRKTASTSTSKPKLVHRVSFREKSNEVNEDYDQTINEMRDELARLKTTDDAPILPKKSILRNRRRSIDDLDVGTKKGLAMYLRSKQA